MLTLNERGRLRDLKQMLKDTDYKVIKCYEAQLLGQEAPYDVQSLIKQRNEWRDEINDLEEML